MLNWFFLRIYFVSMCALFPLTQQAELEAEFDEQDLSADAARSSRPGDGLPWGRNLSPRVRQRERREREREREIKTERGTEGEIERGRDKEREREKENEKEKHREGQRDRGRDKERERERSMERSKRWLSIRFLFFAL